MLSVDTVTKQYAGSPQALRGVTFELRNGVLGLVGPNGAGKSTLLRILATVEQPDSGVVRWRGMDVTRHPEQLRRELGYLPQDFSSYSNLSGREFLQYIGAVKGLRGKALRARIDWALEMVNLSEAAHRPMGTYSGGMRQRAGIAQALLNDPRLLIVDEPTVGLDPGERTRFRHLLTSLSTDRAVILSTHIITDVEAAATQVALLRQGQLVAMESPQDLLQSVDGLVWDVVLAEQETLPAGIIVSTARRTDGLHVRVVTPTRPPRGTPLAPTLEDVYSWTLNRITPGFAG